MISEGNSLQTTESAKISSTGRDGEKPSATENELRDANHSLNLAHRKLQELAVNSAPLGSRISAEQNYGAAYQRLVRLGAAPQIRGKYRRR